MSSVRNVTWWTPSTRFIPRSLVHDSRERPLYRRRTGFRDVPARVPADGPPHHGADPSGVDVEGAAGGAGPSSASRRGRGTTARSVMRDDRTERLGIVAKRVDGEEAEHDRGRRHPEQDDRPPRRPSPTAAGSRRPRRAGRRRASRRSRPTRSRRGRRSSRGRGRAIAGDEQSAVLAEPRAGAEQRRKLPDLRQRGRQARRAEERPVRRPGRRDQRRDRHQREAGVAERRSRGLGDRRLAVPDRLVDGERPEDADRDQHVEAPSSAPARGPPLSAALARDRGAWRP